MTTQRCTQFLILKEKLDTIKQQQNDVKNTIEIVDTCIVKAETMLTDVSTSNNKTARATITIAIYLDYLEENLNICQRVLKSLEDIDTESLGGISCINIHNKSGSNMTSVIQENHNATLDILKAQVEDLQLKALNIEESGIKEVINKMHMMETEISSLKESNQSEFSCINSRLQDMEQLKNFEIQIKKSETEIINLRAKVADLQDQKTAQRENMHKQIEKVNKEMDGLVKLRDLLNQMNSRVTSRAELSAAVAQLQNEIKYIRSEIKSLENSCVKSKDIDDTSNVRPAFSAQVSSSHRILPGKKCPFSKLNLNIWSCFHQHDGVFEAPVSGVYYFSLSANADSSGPLSLAIIHNTSQIALCGTPGAKDSQTSTSALVALEAGDRVWVETDADTDGRGIRIGSGYSNFIGFRVI
ncbi:hypothetical protein Btru_008856 [Bulinus truncatus]|nr:hypothetical protein Btru_008856 [Bulinus truncatus]